MKTLVQKLCPARALFTGLLMLTGCAQYPMGTTKQQWEALSPAQQAEYQSRQYAIDAERNKQYEIRRQEEARQAEVLRQEEARRAEERARFERERLAAAYREARYGDIIVVTVQGGGIAFHGKRYSYEPVAFELFRGERREVQFRREGRSYETTSIMMKLGEDGNTFTFDEPARKRIVITNDGWNRGRTYSGFPDIGSHEGVSEAAGIVIRISLKPLPGGPHKGFEEHHRR